MFLIDFGCFYHLQWVYGLTKFHTILRAYLSSHLNSPIFLRSYGHKAQSHILKKHGGLRTSSGSLLFGSFAGLKKAGNKGSMSLELMLILPSLVLFTVCMCMPLKATMQGMKNVVEAYNGGILGNGIVCVGGEEFAGIDFLVSETEFAYFVPNESVYHTARGCGNLERKMHVGLRFLMRDRRNRNREKYSACYYCDCEDGLPLVYYTDYGTAYHKDRSCSSLRRGVYCVPLSDVGNREECSLCAKKYTD